MSASTILNISLLNKTDDEYDVCSEVEGGVEGCDDPEPVETFTVTFAVNNPDYGSVNKTSATLEYGTSYSVGNNGVLVFRKDSTEVLRVTPTASLSDSSNTYEFTNWSESSGIITKNTTLTATFSHTEQHIPGTHRLTFRVNPESYGSLSLDSHSVTTLDVSEGSTLYISTNAIYINKDTAEEKIIYAIESPSDNYYDYSFDGWTFDPNIISGARGTVESDITITADFSTGDLKPYSVKIKYIEDGKLKEVEITVSAGSKLTISKNEVTVETPSGDTAKYIITAKEYTDTTCTHDFSTWSESSQIIVKDLEVTPSYVCRAIPAPETTPTPEQPYVPNTGIFSNASSITVASGIGLIISLIVLCGALFMTKSRCLALKSRISSLLNPNRFSFYQPIRYAVFTSCLIILILTAIFIFPKTTQDDPTFALDDGLSLTTSGTLEKPIVIEDKTTSYSAVLSDTIKVTSPTTNGYKLYLSVSSESDNSVKSTTSDSTDAFSAISGSNSALSVGTWGYTSTPSPSISAGVWSPVPKKNSEVVLADTSGSATTADAAHIVSYGFNIDNDISSGIYTTTVVYTAIAEPSPEPAVVAGDKTIAASYVNTYVIDEKGELWGWGSDYAGELGVNKNSAYHTDNPLFNLYSSGDTVGARINIPLTTRPVNISQAAFSGKKFQKVVASENAIGTPVYGFELWTTSVFAIDESGELWVWGATNIRAIDDDAEVGGDNDILIARSALGFDAGSADYIATPVNLSQRSGHPFYGKKFTDISSYGGISTYASGPFCGNLASFAIDTDGHLWMWGRTQIDDGEGWYGDRKNYGGYIFSAFSQPIDLSTNSSYGLYGKTFKKVEASGHNVFAIGTDGSLWGFGDNRGSDGVSSLGIGKVSVGRNDRIEDDTKFRDITAVSGSPVYGKKFKDIFQSSYSQDSISTTAIDEDGKLWAWGVFAIGNGNEKNSSSFPTNISDIPESPIYNKKFVKVQAHSTGPYGTLAIEENGELWHWPSGIYKCNGESTHPGFGNSTHFFTHSCIDNSASARDYWPSKSASSSSISGLKFNTLGLATSSGSGNFLVDTNGHLWVYGDDGNRFGAYGNGSYWLQGDGFDMSHIYNPIDLAFMYTNLIMSH